MLLRLLLVAVGVLLEAHVAALASSRDVEVSRHHGGDLFRDCRGCGPDAAEALGGDSCRCQCAPSHHTYREDIRTCVRDLGECRLGAFVRPGAAMEQIPVVFLPLAGQIVHPGAHLSLTGAASVQPLWCRVNRTQYLSSDGWIQASTERAPLFALYQDSNRTFLQWLGDERRRRELQHKLLLLRVRCADAQGAVFEPCVAFRAGWAPGVTSIERKTTDFTIVGLCLGILGLVYVLAVLVYLKVRQGRLKPGFTSYLRDDSDTSQEQEQTAQQRQRIQQNHHASQLTPAPETSKERHTAECNSFRRAALQLSLNPELLEPEMLASPPPPAQEFLVKIREMISAARARLRNFRFRPTLMDIPEDDYFYYQQHQFQQKNGGIRHNPLLSVECHRVFEINESFRDSELKSTVEPDFPPLPPQRRKRRSRDDDDEQVRFDSFRKDLYEKLQKLKEVRDMQRPDRHEDPCDTPPYENVVPSPPPKGLPHAPPPRPPPRVTSPSTSKDIDEDIVSSSAENESFCSPCDSLNSRGRKDLSIPPDQTLLEALDESIIFDSLQDSSCHFATMDSLQELPEQPFPAIDISYQNCGRTPCPRGFDAMEALRKEADFVHVCSRDLPHHSVEVSSIESDSLVVSATQSDAEYDPDYSEPSVRQGQGVAVTRVRRRFRSRTQRNGKQQQNDVTIIEVGDSSGDVLNGKGNFVTLIELETSESSN